MHLNIFRKSFLIYLIFMVYWCCVFSHWSRRHILICIFRFCQRPILQLRVPFLLRNKNYFHKHSVNCQQRILWPWLFIDTLSIQHFANHADFRILIGKPALLNSMSQSFIPLCYMIFFVEIRNFIYLFSRN